jgi:hypothetical protein
VGGVSGYLIPAHRLGFYKKIESRAISGPAFLTCIRHKYLKKNRKRRVKEL